MAGQHRNRQLTPAFVKTVTRPGRYGDGHGGYGLSLLVKESRTTGGRIAKSWAQRVRIGGREVNIGLGRFPILTLSEARALALKNARLVHKGIDPRTPVGVTDFRSAADSCIRLHAANWKNGKQEGQWRSSLEAYAYPVLGDMPIDSIETIHVMRVLLPIWNEKRETASRVRQRIGKVMQWAMSQGHRTDNPVDATGAALPSNGITRKHMEALPFAKVAEALSRVRETKAHEATKLALEFLTLTAARSNEARLAMWSEIDLEGALWTIPGERMKNGREHRVPLSRAALDVLAKAREFKGAKGLVFPTVTGRAMSDSTLSKLCREHQIGCVPHGMRSSFRDWSAECTDCPREICEFALGHIEGSKAELAYRRTDYFVRRRDLMDAWACYLETGK